MVLCFLRPPTAQLVGLACQVGGCLSLCLLLPLFRAVFGSCDFLLLRHRVAALLLLPDVSAASVASFPACRDFFCRVDISRGLLFWLFVFLIVVSSVLYLRRPSIFHVVVLARQVDACLFRRPLLPLRHVALGSYGFLLFHLLLCFLLLMPAVLAALAVSAFPAFVGHFFSFDISQ